MDWDWTIFWTITTVGFFMSFLWAMIALAEAREDSHSHKGLTALYKKLYDQSEANIKELIEVCKSLQGEIFDMQAKEKEAQAAPTTVNPQHFRPMFDSHGALFNVPMAPVELTEEEFEEEFEFEERDRTDEDE